MRRNLLLHCCPMSSWRWNIKQLHNRWDQFNGKIIVAIAEGKNSKFTPVAEVKKEFPEDTKFIVLPNDALIRETKTFRPLLEELKKTAEPDSITFYAHTKGTSHTGPQADAVRLWTSLMYEHNLDYPEKVEKSLETNVITGCFKRYGNFQAFPRGAGQWHYSGTFFWFKTGETFDRNWSNIPWHRYGTECWPGLIFKSGEAGCLFADRMGNPYDIRELKALAGEKK